MATPDLPPLTYEAYWHQSALWEYGIDEEPYLRPVPNASPEVLARPWVLAVPVGWEQIVTTMWENWASRADRVQNWLSFRDLVLDRYQQAIGMPALPDSAQKVDHDSRVWYGAYYHGPQLRPFLAHSTDTIPLRVERAWTLKGTAAEYYRLLAWLREHDQAREAPERPWRQKKCPDLESRQARSASLVPGTVCIKDDDIRPHTVIWMGMAPDGAHELLVATTNPRWCPNCRPVRFDELAAMGHPTTRARPVQPPGHGPKWIKASRRPKPVQRPRHPGYLAPYKTSGANLIPTAIVLSDLRVGELQQEFEGKYLDDQALREAWLQRAGTPSQELGISGPESSDT